MKKNAILAAVALFAPLYLFCQRPFAPVGAKWGSVKYCQGDFFPCPPYYPLQCVFEVTKDTVIQGKYCTLIRENDWEYNGLGNDMMIVHQDGYEIYRYDRDSQVFRLVLDFSKEVGESWKIDVPHWWHGTDTFTITVLEKDGDYRKVTVDEIGREFLLYEGFGGLYLNKRMMLGFEHFISADPWISDELKCYIDPTEGLLYGSASGCVYNSTADPAPESEAFSLSPNPAATQVVLSCEQPLARTDEWRLRDMLGRIVLRRELEPGAVSVAISVENLPVGIYSWEVGSVGKIMGAGKLVVVRQ